MGKGGGGGGQPTQSTAYQTNLPEYAKPYVMNMLGAAQNQLFETTPGTAGAPGEITGFKPYTPYSTDPTKYFAGPSSLQQSTYREAERMQTPGVYGQAQGLAGMSGMGQLGTAQQAGIYGGLGTALGAAGAMQAMPAFSAGQQYAQQVTSPQAMAAYMSPYQQAVTDIAKQDAIRNAQMLEQGNRLSAARQGTYGGARQTLASLEREKNLASNLANIQAQGSQAAYDKAMQAQQFGANLGLQGIQTGLQGVQTGMQGIGQGLQGVGAQQAGYSGAGQAAATLGQLGGAQQQADLARMNLQNTLGQQQQVYQQNIINQAIQDYATAQQYPYMQLSTMSNLLRGLPMQSMSTQTYQAQPSTTQQLLGLAGTGASLYGAMKREGGTIKEYAAGGGIKAYDVGGSVDADIDDIAEAGGIKGLERLLSQTKSPEARKRVMARMREMGIAAAPTGKLGTNMAGGGIVAFGGGGDVPGYYDGDLIDGFGASPESMAMDQLRVDEAKFAEDKKKYDFLKSVSPVAAERMLAENPALERKPVVVTPPAAAPAASPAASPAAAPAAAPANANQSTPGSQETGIAAQLALREKFLGERGAGGAMGEEARGLMDYIKAGKERRESEAGRDRYLRMAQAFSEFGSTAGPFMASASKALGGFAKGEAAAQKDLRAADFADRKMAADIEKGQRLEARGDFDAAQKAYDSAEDRREKRDASIRSAEATLSAASRPGERERIAKRLIEENPNMTMEQAISRATDLMSTSDESKQADLVKAAYTEAAKSVAPGGSNYSQYKKLQEKDPEAAKRFVTELAQRQYQGMRDAMSTITGAKPSSGGKIDTSNPLLKG